MPKILQFATSNVFFLPLHLIVGLILVCSQTFKIIACNHRYKFDFKKLEIQQMAIEFSLITGGS